MKKKISFILLLVLLTTLSVTCVKAGNTSGIRMAGRDSTGEDLYYETIVANIYGIPSECDNQISVKTFNYYDEETKKLVLDNAKDYEHMVTFQLLSEDETVSIEEEFEIYIHPGSFGGGYAPKIGKDYRFYCIEDGVFSEVEILESSKLKVEAKSNKLGTYVLYYDPRICTVIFYEDCPIIIEDDEENVEIIYSPEYQRFENMVNSEKFDYPAIPEKEGYVFTGWKTGSLVGLIYSKRREASYNDIGIYASWCKEEEYTPLEVTLVADEPIKKGEEDGKTLTLTLSEGYFDKDFIENRWYEYYTLPWYEEQELQPGEKEYIEIWEDEFWDIIGTDEVHIKTAEVIDDKNVRLTLIGNSSDTSMDYEIQVKFNGNFYNNCLQDENWNILTEENDVQLNEDGTIRSDFVSDNAVTIEGEKLSAGVRGGGGGGGSTVSRYTVKFETNSDAKINPQTVNKNETATEPEAISKDGYVFDGWYTDSAFTTPYDFNGGVAKNITLYAKWVEEEVTEENKEIILTIGENKINVFGEEKENDVAPVIENDITMLPARFIAEALGANVVWDKKAKSVIIEKDDVKLVITIGEKTAQINGETVELLTPAFIRNDRTYTPIRLISEALGASVEWLGETNTVVITAK